ncbi:MAG: DUF371 domain-containing protein [Ignisphaera sp.]
MVYIQIPVYRDKVTAKGHQAIKALHPTTFELTKDKHLTERGDCIIGVGLDKGVSELDPELKKALRSKTALVILILKVDDLIDTVFAQGDKNLILSDSRRIIVRRSSYIDPATMAINANKSSKSIRRDLIEKLRDPDATLTMEIYVLELSDMLVI